MRTIVFLVLGIVAYFAVMIVGLDAVAEIPLKLTPRENVGATERVLLGAATFGLAAVVLGLLFVRSRKKARRRYPSSIGELDSYTGFLGD